jgi:tetratricopeptide (TPR) repeat protein
LYHFCITKHDHTATGFRFNNSHFYSGSFYLIKRRHKMKNKSIFLLLVLLLGIGLIACSSAGDGGEETAEVLPAATVVTEAPDGSDSAEGVESQAGETANEEASETAVVPTIEAIEESEVVESSSDNSEEPMQAESGTVNFPISCNAEAQAEFNHGLTMLHSFSFPPAVKSFTAVAEADPTCGMAYWGLAMTYLNIPWSPTPPDSLALGQTAVEQALALGAPTEREQAYINAIATFYKDADTLDHGERALAYEAALEQLATDFPEDPEAQIFYALSLLITASPTDKTYANPSRATEILEPIFATQPDHPGVAHYLVHSHDYPDLAAEGLEAALEFAAIAPAAPHALHMPSHIFTRLGYWQDSIDTNMAGAAAANAALAADSEPGTAFEPALHAMDYMMYAYLQLAQDSAAQALVDEISAIKQATGGFGSAYALSAIPARYVLERGAWAEAAALSLHPAGFAWENFPQAEATIVFARGLSAARLGDVEAANQEVAQLEALQEALTAVNQGYWAGQVAIQIEEIRAWAALAEGDTDKALAAMRQAAEMEAATEKHPVTPGPILPANELLGEMLLELDNSAEALAAFETSLQEDPHRFRGVYGAARAAELAGDTVKAEAYYSQLMELGGTADSERPEVVQAQEFLSQ